MMTLRIEVAREAGFTSYVDFAFRQRERFDYGIDDALKFHSAVEHVVVPLARKIQQEHTAALGVPALRPWDTAVDPLGRPPLKPFVDVSRLAEGAETIFREVDPELGRSSPSFVPRDCSTWPIARARRLEATRPRLRTTACRSSS